LENLGFGEVFGFFKVLKGFFDFGVQRRPDTIPTQEEHTILSVTTLFSANYNNTHKSQLRYEIKCDLYKISQKNF